MMKSHDQTRFSQWVDLWLRQPRPAGAKQPRPEAEVSLHSTFPLGFWETGEPLGTTRHTCRPQMLETPTSPMSFVSWFFFLQCVGCGVAIRGWSL